MNMYHWETRPPETWALRDGAYNETADGKEVVRVSD